ncbi:MULTISPECIES: TIGR01458 family HAD-type hydrolase [unclassified Methanoregula]|uniref:TIGR01458 family HAD-type hydrolase n=1 Tax=unclassified Methanoregula TaxID=2649730 RepID=UPI0009D2C3C5|nr:MULTISPECIES: TIGR01458 family HAD-type hydrolase [unclassified Methanoregula]OPX61694.1 MAG: putative HAD-hydrolase [Methanoregula sp. PtaB.Bin085]OPY33997.1 MAG: putative HAD-hydrolase [Methanoregula sp. PtaU1.Bin006]
MKEVRGFLIDLDGVLYTGNQPVEGAGEAIAFLIDHGYVFRCVSNSTRKCRQTIAARLSSMGFDIPADHIFTPPLAAVAHMRKTGKTGYHLLATGDVEKDFTGMKKNEPGMIPDWVVVGDAGDNVTYDSMNTAFRFLMDGAELLALENDRYWMAADGLSLSAGPVVRALEYASGKTALVMGKPSQAFFSLALQDMNLRPDEAVMIGDDIQTDIGGAYHAGMRGILVRTGKYRRDSAEAAPVQPAFTIDSIAHITEVIQHN